MNLNAGINPGTIERGGDKVERRVIAIQMLPKAYDEIQRLKGEETWTRFISKKRRPKGLSPLSRSCSHTDWYFYFNREKRRVNKAATERG